MTAPRIVLAEALDGLAVDDPAALHARRDLRRIHGFMGTRRILLRNLRRCVAAPPPRPLRVLELGAGDGSLLLGVAARLAGEWPGVALTLLDRQRLLAPATAAGYRAAGWSVRTDVRAFADWAARRDAIADGAAGDGDGSSWDLILANLFLHHFDDATLAAMLSVIAGRCAAFLAVEPRRAPLALLASHLVGALGANAVTRSDAVLSVRAGFRDGELGRAWPAGGQWQLREGPAGLFSHVFMAVQSPRALR
jgi:hypothetical protein